MLLARPNYIQSCCYTSAMHLPTPRVSVTYILDINLVRVLEQLSSKTGLENGSRSDEKQISR